MYIFKHGVLSNRNDTFSVSIDSEFYIKASNTENHRKIFFGIAKGAGAITDILATIAMCLFLSTAKTGISQ
jgi:hypothetical protein